LVPSTHATSKKWAHGYVSLSLPLYMCGRYNAREKRREGGRERERKIVERRLLLPYLFS
jgi:hypothetical protein